jgi:hypothetical protein
MPATTTSDEELLQRNLLFLTTPRLWPDWPFLPLVRRTPPGEDLGLLYDCLSLDGRTGFSATVFFANLFLLPPTEDEFLALPKEVFATPEEVYSAGWRVD